MKSIVFHPNFIDKVYTSVQVDTDTFKTSILQNGQVFKKPNPSTNVLAIHDLLYPIIREEFSGDPTGIMPPGVLAITKNFVIFERPPEYKNVFIVPAVVSDMRNRNYDDQEITYRLPLPWQLYIVHYNVNVTPEGNQYYTTDVRMHFMNSNLSFFDQPVYSVPLPNFYANGNLCRPMFSSMDEIERYSKDISGVIQSAYDWIWNNGTNLDLTESVVQYIIQMRYQDIATTVFGKNFKSYPIQLSNGTYYANMDTIDLFLREWENYSLEEVVQMFWPQNSKTSSHNNDYRLHAIHHLPIFLRERGEEAHYELHYDDDDDDHPGRQCELTTDPDEFCDCMFPQNYYNESDFRKWLSEKYEFQLTAKDSIESYFKDFTHSGAYISEYRSRMMYNNMLTKMVYSA